MFTAARAQGSPIMVIAMTTAAISQPAAIHRPPNTIHSRLSRSDTGDMNAAAVSMTRRVTARRGRELSTSAVIRQPAGRIASAVPRSPRRLSRRPGLAALLAECVLLLDLVAGKLEQAAAPRQDGPSVRAARDKGPFESAAIAGYEHPQILEFSVGEFLEKGLYAASHLVAPHIACAEQVRTDGRMVLAVFGKIAGDLFRIVGIPCRAELGRPFQGHFRVQRFLPGRSDFETPRSMSPRSTSVKRHRERKARLPVGELDIDRPAMRAGNFRGDVEAKAEALLIGPDLTTRKRLKQAFHRSGRYGRSRVCDDHLEEAGCRGLDADRLCFSAMRPRHS